MRRTSLLIGLILVGAALVLVACGGAATPTEVAPVEPTEAPAPELVVPYEEAWAASPHADASAEAFRHWDEEDPAGSSGGVRQVPLGNRVCRLPRG